MKCHILAIALLLVGLAPTLARAQDLQSALRDRWLDKNISLRAPDSSDELRFNADGQRIGPAKPGEWYSDTDLRVTSVSVAGGQIDIGAKRMDIIFDYQGGSFSDIPSDRTVRVLIALPPGEPEVSRVEPALNKIFLTANEKPTDFAPEYWQLCLKHLRLVNNEWTCSVPNETKSDFIVDPATGETIYIDAAVKGLTPARPTKTAAVRYTKLAKQLRWQGTILLRAIVDKSGKPNHIQIVNPLGYGLDDEAVRTVERWKFKPAKKDGKAVAMRIGVNLAFQYQTGWE